MSSPPRVLLTGATGFVGSHAARVLVGAGCEVWALVRPGSSRLRLADVESRLTVVEGDLRSLIPPGVLPSIEPEICLHLAWYAEPGRYLHAVCENLACLRDGLDFAQALASSGCRRLVVAGTCAEYGPASSDIAFSEESPVRPSTPYARAKAALHLAAHDVAATGGMELAWARLFFLYGPGDRPARIVPAAARAALRGEVFPSTAGEQLRDYLHVADAAEALWSVAASPVTGPVNICSGTAVTLRSVLEAVESAAGSPGAARFGDLAYRQDEWMWMRGTNNKLLDTGWTPRFSLKEGIAETVAWCRSRLMIEERTPLTRTERIGA